MIEEISEEDLCKKVTKNFEEFVLKKENTEGAEPDEDGENEENKEDKAK